MIHCSKIYEIEGTELGVLECVMLDTWQHLTDIGKNRALTKQETNLLADVALANRIIQQTAAQA